MTPKEIAAIVKKLKHGGVLVFINEDESVTAESNCPGPVAAFGILLGTIMSIREQATRNKDPLVTEICDRLINILGNYGNVTDMAKLN